MKALDFVCQLRALKASSMHLLIVNTEKNWRGGERQTLHNAVGFMQQGVLVELLCRTGAPLVSKARAAGIQVHEVGGNITTFWWIARHAAKYDLIQAQTAKAQTAAVITKPFHGRPVVYTRRVNFVPRGWLTRLKYKKTDCVVAISCSVKGVLEVFGIHNVHVIYDVVVPRELNKQRAVDAFTKLNVAGKKVVATIAALDHDKDPFTMVEAIKKLSLLRSDFVFLHFGDGPLKKQVQQRIDELGLHDRYILMGFVADVEDLFSLLDLFCISSREEGLCSSVLDAFAYHVPVVSTNAGGLAELVDGRGFLCEVGDFEGIALGIDQILESPSAFNVLKDAAYRYVVSQHSLQTTTKQYLDLFRLLIDGADKHDSLT